MIIKDVDYEEEYNSNVILQHFSLALLYLKVSFTKYYFVCTKLMIQFLQIYIIFFNEIFILLKIFSANVVSDK